MTFVEILTLLFAGLVTNNAITVSAVGVDTATNGFDSIKNASIYALIIFSVTLLSTLSMFGINLILESLSLEKFFIIVLLLIVSMFVQIADYICTKVCPLFLKQSYGFVAVLTLTCFVLSMSIVSATASIWYILLKVIFDSLGIYMIMAIVAGVRHNSLFDDKPAFMKGNALSLLIIFVLFVIFTAF